jgi:hypothetical protein
VAITAAELVSTDALLKRAFKLKEAHAISRIRTISIAVDGDYAAAEKHALTTRYAREGDLIVLVHRFADGWEPETPE